MFGFQLKTRKLDILTFSYKTKNRLQLVVKFEVFIHILQRTNTVYIIETRFI